MNTLGKRIKFVRGSETQESFAARIGVGKGSIGGYERDENSPSAEAILKMCSGANISVEWLMTGNGPMRPGEQPSPQPDFISTATESCAKCAMLEEKIQILRELKDSQDETIRAQAETIRMYKSALDAAQQEAFKGDRGMPVVPPSARTAPTSTEINK